MVDLHYFSTPLATIRVANLNPTATRYSPHGLFPYGLLPMIRVGPGIADEVREMRASYHVLIQVYAFVMATVLLCLAAWGMLPPPRP